MRPCFQLKKNKVIESLIPSTNIVNEQNKWTVLLYIYSIAIRKKDTIDFYKDMKHPECSWATHGNINYHSHFCKTNINKPWLTSVLSMCWIGVCVYPQKLNKILDLFLYIWVFCLHIYVCTTCIQCPRRQEDIRSPSVGATNACEPPCRCWKLNQVLWRDQQGILTTKPTL